MIILLGTQATAQMDMPNLNGAFNDMKAGARAAVNAYAESVGIEDAIIDFYPSLQAYSVYDGECSFLVKTRISLLRQKWVVSVVEDSGTCSEN